MNRRNLKILILAFYVIAAFSLFIGYADYGTGTGLEQDYAVKAAAAAHESHQLLEKAESEAQTALAGFPMMEQKYYWEHPEAADSDQPAPIPTAIAIARYTYDSEFQKATAEQATASGYLKKLGDSVSNRAENEGGYNSFSGGCAIAGTVLLILLFLTAPSKPTDDAVTRVPEAVERP
jgi:hypothetical protein